MVMKKQLETFLTAKVRVDTSISIASAAYIAAVQAIANHYRVTIATGQMSDIWQIKNPKTNEWLCEGESKHPALKALEKLDLTAREIGIGPTNMERYEPK